MDWRYPISSPLAIFQAAIWIAMIATTHHRMPTSIMFITSFSLSNMDLRARLRLALVLIRLSWVKIADRSKFCYPRRSGPGCNEIQSHYAKPQLGTHAKLPLLHPTLQSIEKANQTVPVCRGVEGVAPHRE